MVKLVDVSHIRRAENEGWPIKKESWLKRAKNFILSIPIKKLIGWSVFAIIMFLLLKLAVFSGFQFRLFSNFPAIDKTKWQTVFLNNNQIYFGHLQKSSGDYMILENVYYLTQPSKQQQVNLVKLSNELHSPENIMYIPKQQIIFWQNLKANSPVIEAIKQVK